MSVRARYAIYTLCLAIVSLSLSAETPRPQPPPEQTFHFDARLGFESWVVPQRWNPLFVDADPSIEGLRIEVSHGSAAVEVFTEIDSKVLEIPVYADENNQSIEVSWFVHDTLIGSRRLRTLEKSFPGNLVLASGIPASADTLIPQLLLPFEPVRLAHARVRDLPARSFDYEALRALVLEDPGPILSPAQRESLDNWLRAGGRLVVLSARTGGFLSQFMNASPASDFSVPLGLGSVSAYGDDGSDWDRNAWKDALDLKGFENGGPVISSQAFPKTLVSSLKAVEVSSDPGQRMALVAAVFLWAGGLFGIRYLRRLRLSAIALWTLAWLVGAILLAPSLEWDRGYQSRIRIIQAPGARAALTDVEIWLPSPRVGEGFAMDSSPWGIELTGAGDIATLGPRYPSVRLRHGSDAGAFSLRAGREGYLRIEAWIDRDSISTPKQLSRLESGPQPLGDEGQWVSDLMRKREGIHWELGTATDLPLSISGLKSKTAVYVSEAGK